MIFRIPFHLGIHASLLLLVAACGRSLPSSDSYDAAGDAERPNILVIITDDQGYGDVSYNPHHPPEVHTPNIDALASEGVIFTNGYVTAPNCAPSRAALLTGRYQQRFGFYTPGDSRAGLPLDEITLADVLREEGYATGAFGKWHLGLMPEHNPVERGFDEFYGFLGHGAHDYFDLSIPWNRMSTAIRRGHEAIDDEGYLTNRITEEAISFMDRNRDGPFFAYVAYNAVHWPAQAPDEYVEHYDTDDGRRDTLLAMLEVMDEDIGKMFDFLEETGEFDNTLIFYLSDNGGAGKMHANNDPLRGAKQHMYEGGIRVPFFVTWPGHLEAGTQSDVPVVAFDIFTTAVDVAGGQVPQDRPIDGRNLLPAGRREVDQLHERLYWEQSENDRAHWAVRGDGWKLVIDRGNPGLFDLDEDVSEANNLMQERSELMERLQADWQAWRDKMIPQIPESERKSREEPLGDEYISDDVERPGQ